MATESGETRWLDEREMGTWLRFAPMLFRLPLELDRQLQRDADLSLVEYLVMAGLSDAPERTLRMSQLASWAGVQLPRLSQLAARMEGRGWITRTPDPTDGRYTLATLTDKGFRVLANAAPGHVEAVRRLVIDPLTSAQITQLGAASERILRAVDPDGSSRPGGRSGCV